MIRIPYLVGLAAGIVACDGGKDDGGTAATVSSTDGGGTTEATNGESTVGGSRTGPGTTRGGESTGPDTTDSSPSGSETTVGEPEVCDEPDVPDECAAALPRDPGLGLIHARLLQPEVLQFKKEGFGVCDDSFLENLLACGACGDFSDGAYRLTFPEPVTLGTFSAEADDFALESASSESLAGKDGCDLAEDVLDHVDVTVADANDACLVGTVDLAGSQYHFAAVDCP